MDMPGTPQREATREKRQERRRRARRLAVIAVLVAPALAAQGGSWSERQSFGWNQPAAGTKGGEIAHAALVGASGSYRGKVILWRTHVPGFGIWLWNPAAPSSVSHLDPDAYRVVYDNIFCAGHSFDGEGFLVIAGGDRSPACSLVEANWSYFFDPFQSGDTIPLIPPWFGPFGMLTLYATNPAKAWGHYYPGTVVDHLGRVWSWGGSTSPWMCTNPEIPVPNGALSNEGQVFNRTPSPPASPRWEGASPGMPFAGLPTLPTTHPCLQGALPQGWTAPVKYEFSGEYPHVHNTSDRSFLASVVTNALDANSPPPGVSPIDPKWSATAVADISTGIPGAWRILCSRMTNQAGEAVDLLYPTGFVVPWVCGATPQPIGSDRIVILGGWDLNLDDNYDARGLTTGGVKGSPAERGIWELRKTDPSLAWDATLTGGAQNAVWTRNPFPWPASGMTVPRAFTYAVILPDLRLLVVGGSKNYFKPYAGRANPPPAIPAANEEADPDPVYTPERIDLLALMAGQQVGWEALANHVSPRLYHCVVLLLPDGRVWVAGGYNDTGPPPPWAGSLTNHSDLEIFSPPYISAALHRPQFVGDGISPVTYGQDILANTYIDPASNASIQFATLIRCGAATHQFDWDQRVVKLEIKTPPQSGSGLITFYGLPSKQNNGDSIAPPGYYMMFLVSTPQNGERVPSVAKMVKVQ